MILGILIGWIAATLMATLIVGLSDRGNRRYQQGWMDAMRQENPPEIAEIEGQPTSALGGPFLPVGFNTTGDTSGSVTPEAPGAGDAAEIEREAKE